MHLGNIPCFGQVAQSVEQRTENPRVGSSILSLAIFSPLVNQLVRKKNSPFERLVFVYFATTLPDSKKFIRVAVKFRPA